MRTSLNENKTKLIRESNDSFGGCRHEISVKAVLNTLKPIGKIKPTKDKKLIEEITAELYGDFHTWKESSYYGLSKINQENWRVYGEDVAEIIEKLGYSK